MNRRTLCKSLGLGVGAACLAAHLAEGAPKRRLKVGYTSITWGFRPENVEPGIRDSAKLGYHGYEAFGDCLEPLEAQGGIGKLLETYKIPLPSTYFAVTLNDPAKRKDEIAKVIRWGKILKKCGGSVAVLGPNGVNRDTFDFNAAKAEIVSTLNEMGQVLNDLGLVASIHQHTRTCIMTREEVYAVMEAVNTRHVMFGPDVAQLAASGSDPVKIVKDFQSIIRSVHLKDYLGGPHWSGYCPLGQGKVDLPAVIELLEKAKRLEYIMVELDPSRNPPLPPFESAKTSKEYLEKQGYTFRA